MNKVSDALHGSYYIEKVTQSLYKTKKIASETIAKLQNTKTWNTDEEIILKSKYYKKDVENIQHLNFGVGIPPYLRGPYLTMYCDRKWTIRQYSGFSTATESNKFYKKNLAAGQSGLSVAFDLPTHRGYDSDHHRVLGDVGKAGVAIDSIEDMETLFEGINLKNTSVSMTMNGAIIPIMAFFIAVVKNKKIPLNKIRGTIQNDILKEFMVRNTYIYPPKASMKIVGDIFKYVAQHMPKFNSISVSGYHMLEAGASADIELAYTLADGLEYVRTGIKSGLKIDEFAPRLSFFWGIGMNFFMEIAKMRAARILWAEIIQSFNPQNPKSMMLRSHCQTSGWSLTAQEPLNNITRTTIEAVAATIGGTQSLHTNALDEAISLPTTYSAKIARDTQIFLQNETDICKTIDAFGGSYYIEKLTEQIKEKAKKHIQEIEAAGGMLKAIEKGIPKLKIETSAVKRQTNIDNGKNLIIGLNCFQNNQKNNLDVLEINNEEVQKIQIKNIKKIRKYRNEKNVKECLKNITKSCKSNNGNLLDLAVKAAEAKATTGEISNALELVFGRHEANTQIISGIYKMEQKNDTNFILAKQLTDKFEKEQGRRPRILTAKLGQDGHDRGIKIIATSFSDIGFDVDIAPLFQTPTEIAKQAIENDVHIIGISSLAGGHKTLIPELINNLHKKSRHDIMIIAGGIIPEKDHEYLMKKGVIKIFGPGTIVIEAAIEILNELLKK
ncbi:MAG: methylmalonyl-CoA mutase [Flavobacteriales bacterium]|nr:methylmalonyl-CoA mutase [Flavobacteriales bacterium]